MNTCPLNGRSETFQRTQGLAVSLLLHAMALSAAVLFMAHVRLVPQPQMFKWDVAMVDAPSQQQPHDNPIQPQTQMEPTSIPPPSPAPRRMQKTMETQPIVQAVQPVQQVVTQEVVHTRPLAQTATEVIHHSTVEAPQTISRHAQAIETPTLDLPAPSTSAPVNTATPIERDTAVTHSNVETTQMSPAVQERVVNETASTIPESTAVVERVNLVEVAAAAPSSMSELPIRPAPSMPDTDTTTASSPVQHAKLPGPLVAKPSALQEPFPQSRPAVKADFGWLAQALLNRIQQLKRYPHAARANHWEGKVVLRAVIGQDGRVIRVEIAESSGHTELDDDAIEVIRKASPLELAHPLGQSQVIVRVPIRYRLEQ